MSCSAKVLLQTRHTIGVYITAQAAEALDNGYGTGYLRLMSLMQSPSFIEATTDHVRLHAKDTAPQPAHI